MSSANSTNLIDWISVTLRWLALASMAISFAFQDPFSIPIALVLLAAALGNILFSTFAVKNRRLMAQRYIIVAVDMILAYLLFYLSGTFNGYLGWVGLLPLVSASLYFQWKGAILITAVNILVQGSMAFLASPPLSVLIYVLIFTPLYLGLGYLLSYLSRQITDLLAAVQETQRLARRDAERIERERRRAIYNLITTLSSSLNYQRVLDTALDLSASALATLDAATTGEADALESAMAGAPARLANNISAEKLTSAVLLFSENEDNLPELHIGSSRRFTPADMRMTLPGTGGLIGRCIDDGEPRLSKDIAKDPELSRIVALRVCQSAYCNPLRTGLDTYGVLLFAHPDPEFFDDDRREILDIVGNQAVIAIQNARLYQDLEQEKERMTEIQEEARKKIARDLHDGPTQSVAAIAMRVNFARRLIDRDVKAASDELFKIEDLARRTTKEIRHMLFTLRPLVLESQGLIAALESMAGKMAETYGQNVILQADPRVIEQMEPGKQGVAFYIAEEAVNNARKHAKAANVWVRLKSLQPDLILLEIEDDGVGFNTEAVDSAYENRDSLGMVNMRERTELVNGVLQIDSGEGRGTRIRVLIPCNEATAERIRRGL